MGSPSVERLDTFTIALTDPVELTHALQPGNDSERILFRNLLPSLIWLDCQESPRPGVIQSWSTDSGGVWTFTLQDGARFASGRPISAADVAGTLAPAGQKVPGIDSVVVLNDRRLRLFTALDGDSVLRALADPTFAMLDGLASEGPIAGQVFHLPTEANQPAIGLRLPPLGDPRDALDRGADLIVTRDPTLLEYAARRPEFSLHPLPWDKTYVLAQPARVQSLAAVSTDAERQSLARDAVEADARPAEPPFWWSGRSCPAAEPRAVASTSDRVVYLREDAVARALAERLVALAGPANRLRAAALEQTELAGALRSGSERAYVLGLPRTPLQPCRELSNFPAGTRIQPLIDSRAHAIVRLGAPPLSVDWDGTVRVVSP